MKLSTRIIVGIVLIALAVLFIKNRTGNSTKMDETTMSKDSTAVDGTGVKLDTVAIDSVK